MRHLKECLSLVQIGSAQHRTGGRHGESHSAVALVWPAVLLPELPTPAQIAGRAVVLSGIVAPSLFNGTDETTDREQRAWS